MTPTEEQIEAGARLLAEWIGYDFDGIAEGRIGDKGFPQWKTSGAFRYQGRKQDLRDIAAAIQAASAPALPCTWHKIIKNYVECCRDSIRSPFAEGNGVTGHKSPWRELRELADAPPSPAVQIKQLEFYAPRHANTLKRADTIVGTYRIWTHHEANGEWFWNLDNGFDAIEATVVFSEEEAFSAVRLDYEKRIRSSLIDSREQWAVVNPEKPEGG